MLIPREQLGMPQVLLQGDSLGQTWMIILNEGRLGFGFDVRVAPAGSNPVDVVVGLLCRGPTGRKILSIVDAVKTMSQQ